MTIKGGSPHCLSWERFNQFTGLENIYLNAALLGLSQNETDDNLDAILSFADIGDFVHQPVDVLQRDGAEAACCASKYPAGCAGGRRGIGRGR